MHRLGEFVFLVFFSLPHPRGVENLGVGVVRRLIGASTDVMMGTFFVGCLLSQGWVFYHILGH